MEIDFGLEDNLFCSVVIKYSPERVEMYNKRGCLILEKLKRVCLRDITETDCLKKGGCHSDDMMVGHTEVKLTYRSNLEQIYEMKTNLCDMGEERLLIWSTFSLGCIWLLKFHIELPFGKCCMIKFTLHSRDQMGRLNFTSCTCVL